MFINLGLLSFSFYTDINNNCLRYSKLTKLTNYLWLQNKHSALLASYWNWAYNKFLMQCPPPVPPPAAPSVPLSTPPIPPLSSLLERASENLNATLVIFQNLRCFFIYVKNNKSISYKIYISVVSISSIHHFFTKYFNSYGNKCSVSDPDPHVFDHLDPNPG